MYIAVLNLAISPPQVLETLVVLSTFDFFRYVRSRMKTIAVQAESKGGRVRIETTPFLGRVATAVHALAFHVPPIVYIIALVLNAFRQPAWMAQIALPDEVAGLRFDPAWKGPLRAGACAAGLVLKNVVDAAFYHLGDQWHSLGRRERPRIVKTGPYAWVRHPLYAVVLVQEALWAVSFWSYAPLVALGITTAAFAVKMPLEEEMIQRDDAVRDDYRDYKKAVPARIIPYVW